MEHFQHLKEMSYQAHETIWRKLKSILLSEKNSQSEKGHILYDPKFRTFCKRHDYGDI